jgi:hypothetical protein
VLFNGGVMKAARCAGQVSTCSDAGTTVSPLSELEAVDLDQAVAIGATYYGLGQKRRWAAHPRRHIARLLHRRRERHACRAGHPYAGQRALRGAVRHGRRKRGRHSPKEFGLVVGEPAHFQLLESTTNKEDQAGRVIEDWGGDLQEVTTMEALLPATENESGGTILPVWLQSRVTEIGTLGTLVCGQRERSSLEAGVQYPSVNITSADPSADSAFYQSSRDSLD